MGLSLKQEKPPSLEGVGSYLFQDKATVWGKTTQTFHVWEKIWDLIRGRWKRKEVRHLQIIFVGWVLSQAEQTWANYFNLNLPNSWTFPSYTSIWILHQGLRYWHILSCFSDLQMQAILPGHLLTFPLSCLLGPFAPLSEMKFQECSLWEGPQNRLTFHGALPWQLNTGHFLPPLWGSGVWRDSGQWDIVKRS